MWLTKQRVTSRELIQSLLFLGHEQLCYEMIKDNFVQEFGAGVFKTLSNNYNGVFLRQQFTVLQTIFSKSIPIDVLQGSNTPLRVRDISDNKYVSQLLMDFITTTMEAE